MNIIIWDTNAQRIACIDRNLRIAMQQLGMRGLVTSMSEPPLIGRMGLIGKTPVLEIGGFYWSLKAGSSISVEECLNLLRKLPEGG